MKLGEQRYFENNGKTMEHSDHWMAWRTVGFSKQK
jgi:hypothetical protein